MSERIERWVNVYPKSLGDTYELRESADHAAGPSRIRAARCVEIRDGEPHPDDVPTTIAALTERAEKAEVTVRARDAEIEVLRQLLKQFEDGGMSGREVREAKADERERFRRDVMRESYQRMLANSSVTNAELVTMGLTFEQYCAREAKAEAAVLTDAAFGFPPAKEV